MKNYLKFWGTRGSCAVSGEPFKYYGGNTSCLEVAYQGTRILIDAGTGIRPIGSILFQEEVRKINLFLGHSHWDHLIGFPFFEPLHLKGAQITIWAPAGTGRSSKELFNDLMSTEFFPVRLDEIEAQIEFRTIDQKTPVQIGPLTIDFHTTHHPGLTYCFKIKTPCQTICYATDNEVLQGYHGPLSEIPPALFEPHQSLIDFFKGADLLVHEAQYFPDEYLEKAGWGHSSVQNAAALIKQTQVPLWFVTHHDPKHIDEDLHHLSNLAKSLLKENQIPCQVEWIGDDHIFELKDQFL